MDHGPGDRLTLCTGLMVEWSWRIELAAGQAVG